MRLLWCVGVVNAVYTGLIWSAVLIGTTVRLLFGLGRRAQITLDRQARSPSVLVNLLRHILLGRRRRIATFRRYTRLSILGRIETRYTSYSTGVFQRSKSLSLAKKISR